MMVKPVIEFYETGIRKDSLLRDVSINQVEFSSFELWNASGMEKIKEWIEHFWWHVDPHQRSWVPITALIGAVGGVVVSRRLEGAAVGGVIGTIGGAILDQLKPTCNFCSRTYPPRFL